MSRNYNKKSDYWEKRKITSKSNTLPLSEIKRIDVPEIDYQWDGNKHFSSMAACGGGGSINSTRDGGSQSVMPVDRFHNINEGMLPWETSNGYFSVAWAIVLCQRAYANVAVFRNAIEGAVEFSNSILHIKTPNERVKDFFSEWFDRINIYKLKENFFREYYRSGNVFLYQFNGRIADNQFAAMKTVFGSKSPLLPIRYVILNPAQIYLISGVSYNNNYVKALSRYEIERLKTPMTEEDKQIFNSLPDNVKKLIQSGGSFREIFIPLDRERLKFAFYKKQDYEPLALPFGFPILNDLEWKLDLKKMDMSLSKTIEHVILLITNGEKVDANGGGINPRNIANLQEIFRNQTLGRVLVADYTTKGQWLIPEIGSILGPEKYSQVEKDIREGLQSIMYGGGEEKFANAVVKAKIYIERMKEGQRAFMNNFLIPEVKKICEAMNFKNVPEIEFEQIDLTDESHRERVLLRMTELGILTPDEVMVALQSGILPDKESALINQQEYKILRDKGLYQPLMGAGKAQNGGEGRPSGSGSPKISQKVGPIGQKSAKGEELESHGFSMKKISNISNSAENLKDKIIQLLEKKFNLDKLNDIQLSIAEKIVKSIITNEKEDEWNKKIKEYIKNPKDIDAKEIEKINDIAIEYDLSDWNATIVNLARI